MGAYFFLSLALLLSSLICFATAMLSLTREDTQGRRYLFVLLLSTAFWSLMEGLLFQQASFDAKILLAKIQYLGIIVLPAALFLYILAYMDSNLPKNKVFVVALMILPALTLGLAWTNEHHYLLWSRIDSLRFQGLVVLDYKYGPFFYVYYIYAFILVLVVVALVVHKILTVQPPFRAQFLVLLAAMMPPLGFSGISLANLLPWEAIDLTPLGFGFACLVFALGFFRYQLQELKPLAQQKVLAVIPDGVLVLDSQDRILMVNRGLGFPPRENPESYVGRDVSQLYERFPGLEKVMHQARQQDWLEWEDQRRDMVWDVRVSLLQDRRFTLRGRLLVFRDITARKAMERNLKHLATTDSLTGVLNRRYFAELAQAELRRAERYDYPVSLLYIDADHFKKVNDTWGHDTGDQVLVGLVETLKRGLREADLLARMGGEEFVVLLPHSGASEATGLAERLLSWIREMEIPLEEGTLSITVSIGVALHEKGSTFDQLLIKGDLALYQAKSEGRNRVVLQEGGS